jgi:hypothetical protein
VLTGETLGEKIQVIVPGDFGEAIKELDPLLYRMAKLTAKTPLGQMLAPKTSQTGNDVKSCCECASARYWEYKWQ